MSKIIAFLFGAFLTITLLVFALMLLVHISRVMFARDRLIGIKEFFSLMLWWLAMFNAEGRERIYCIIFKRNKKRRNK